MLYGAGTMSVRLRHASSKLRSAWRYLLKLSDHYSMGEIMDVELLYLLEQQGLKTWQQG